MSLSVMAPIQTHRIADLDRRYATMRLASPPQLSRLQASIEQEGLRHPVLASNAVEAGVLVLLDGFKRQQALLALGQIEVPVRVMALAGADACAAILSANEREARMSDLEQAWVVQALHRDHGLTQVQIGQRLGRHKSWVCRRLQLVERLESRVQDDVRLGLLSSRIAQELVRLPRGNQALVASAVAQHRLTSRQVARLVDVFLRTDPSERNQILADPLGHLPRENESDASIPPDPRLSAAGSRVRQCLLRMHAAANRLIELVLDQPPATLRARDACALQELTWTVSEQVGRALEGLHALERAATEAQHAE